MLVLVLVVELELDLGGLPSSSSSWDSCPTPEGSTRD